MGSQTRFYTLPEDESILVEFIFSNNNLVLIKEDCFSQNPEVIQQPHDYFANMKGQVQELIWYNTSPIPNYSYRKILNNISNSKSSDDILHNRFYLTALDTPCIEYSRSFINSDNELTQGRIWIESSYWYKNALIKKSSDFVTVYKRIRNWIRNNFIKVNEVDGFLGQGAYNWYQSGKAIYPPPLKK
jgi:hypothetical protein